MFSISGHWQTISISLSFAKQKSLSFSRLSIDNFNSVICILPKIFQYFYGILFLVQKFITNLLKSLPVVHVQPFLFQSRQGGLRLKKVQKSFQKDLWYCLYWLHHSCDHYEGHAWWKLLQSWQKVAVLQISCLLLFHPCRPLFSPEHCNCTLKFGKQTTET